MSIDPSTLPVRLISSIHDLLPLGTGSRFRTATSILPARFSLPLPDSTCTGSFRRLDLNLVYCTNTPGSLTLYVRSWSHEGHFISVFHSS